MSQRFHKFWLKVTAIVVGSFGPVFFLGTMLATAEPARLSLDLLTRVSLFRRPVAAKILRAAVAGPGVSASARKDG